MDQQNVGPKPATSANTKKVAAKTQEAAAQMKDTVVEQVNQIRDRALSAQERAGDRIRGAATHLREMSHTLREDDPLVAGVAERASQGVESVARYVSSATPQSVIRDTEDLARRQPALFYGAAVLVGLAVGRFLKSSRPDYGGASRTPSWRNDAEELGWRHTQPPDSELDYESQARLTTGGLPPAGGVPGARDGSGAYDTPWKGSPS